MPKPEPLDLVIVGGGQSGLSVAWYARRTRLRFAVLDEAEAAGGTWPAVWPSLRLFSPAEYSSLPGWRMPTPPEGPDALPGRDHVVSYLRDYEARYELRVHRPVRVSALEVVADGTWLVHTDGSTWRARHVVNATGTWGAPFVPHVRGAADFPGAQLHAARYRGPDGLAGRRVLVVGGGNSGAQIAAELSRVTPTSWATREPVRFLPDDVDGRVLFDRATARAQRLAAGQHDPGGAGTLGDVVATADVRRARDQGGLRAVPGFCGFDGADAVFACGTRRTVDVVVWATGFRSDLGHLRGLSLGRPPATEGTRALDAPGLWFVGYGDWTGPASATLIGVGRTARETVKAIVADLRAT